MYELIIEKAQQCVSTNSNKNEQTNENIINNSRELLTLITTLTDYSTITIDQLKNFISSIYEIILITNTTVKAALLRVIRLSLITPEHCYNIFNTKTEQYNIWLIISSLENDSDNALSERVEALKVLIRYKALSPQVY